MDYVKGISNPEGEGSMLIYLPTGRRGLIFIKYMTLLHMILKGVGDKNHKYEKSEKMPI